MNGLGRTGQDARWAPQGLILSENRTKARPGRNSYRCTSSSGSGDKPAPAEQGTGTPHPRRNEQSIGRGAAAHRVPIGCDVGQAPPLTAALGLHDTTRKGAGAVGGGGASWAVRELNQNGGHGRWVGGCGVRSVVSEEVVCGEGAGGRENYRVPVRFHKETKIVATELEVMAAVAGQHLAARLKQQSLSNQPSDLQKAVKWEKAPKSLIDTHCLKSA